MSATVGPDGQPSRFDGAAWVSADGRFWWNGAAWQPMRRTRSGPSGLVIVLAIFVVAAVAFIGYKLFQTVTEPFAGDGVSNTQIDSSTQIEFDYYRGSTCNNLTFDYRFYDSSGRLVDEFQSDQGHHIDGGSRNHITVVLDHPLPSVATRFEAVATCSG